MNYSKQKQILTQHNLECSELLPYTVNASFTHQRIAICGLGQQLGCGITFYWRDYWQWVLLF